MASTPTKMSGDRGDKDVVLQNGEPEIIRYNTPLTAARSLRLPKPADNGDRFFVLRLAAATGAFNLNIQDPAGATLKALASANSFAQFYYSDAYGWVLVAAGSL